VGPQDDRYGLNEHGTPTRFFDPHTFTPCSATLVLFRPYIILFRSKTPLLTLHDVAIDHKLAFQPLLACAGPSSRLVQQFCYYHIDAPGHDAEGEGFSEDAKNMSLEDLAAMVHSVIKALHLQEVVLMGMGAGATVMARVAADHPRHVVGLIAVSPCVRKPGWWEWTLGKMATTALSLFGGKLQHTTESFLLARLFSSNALELIKQGGDRSRTFQRAIHRKNAMALHGYLAASLGRGDLRDLSPKIRCRTLLILGEASMFYGEGLEWNATMDRSRTSLIQIEQAGTHVFEENPLATIGPLDAFIQDLQIDGYCTS